MAGIKPVALQFLCSALSYRATVASSGLKISFTGPSDKMSGDVEFGSDICPMTFSSVLAQK